MSPSFLSKIPILSIIQIYAIANQLVFLLLLDLSLTDSSFDSEANPLYLLRYVLCVCLLNLFTRPV